MIKTTVTRNKITKKNKQEINTIDTKYHEMTNYIKNSNKIIEAINQEINSLTKSISEIDLSYAPTLQDALINLKKRAELLDKLRFCINKKELLESKYEIVDYYNTIGDVLDNYYKNRETIQHSSSESVNILEYLNSANKVKQNQLLENYYYRTKGINITEENGSNRIKYCATCNIEKLFDMSESAYICPCCGDMETIIFDEDRQIKDYSPYRRLNHFKEWLNQFQAKQSPDIPQKVFIDIIDELNKMRYTDLSKINKNSIKIILKKLHYNSYYEHATYIINKLNNLTPPRITRDMESIFINMFYKIQEPWEKYKQPKRKNFLSYSFVLRKMCELLELDHLLEIFPLHKDTDKVIENDSIWEKICNHLNWEFIPSFS